MNKAQSRRSSKNKASYAAQFGRTRANKIRRLERRVRRFPRDAGAKRRLAELRKET